MLPLVGSKVNKSDTTLICKTAVSPLIKCRRDREIRDLGLIMKKTEDTGYKERGKHLLYFKGAFDRRKILLWGWGLGLM